MATPHSSRLSVLRTGTKPGCSVYRCECGTEKEVRRTHVNAGRVLSCGCLNRSIHAAKLRTHGLSKTPEYRVWTFMIVRCTNVAADDYPRYGGRGITVCDRWRESFENFFADMGTRPTTGHSIERKDNDGPYSPENCVWATREVQGRNKRNNRRIEVDGVTRTAIEWAEVTGIKAATICKRIEYGWDAKRAVTAPVFRGRWK
jgi:hypothetical protein